MVKKSEADHTTRVSIWWRINSRWRPLPSRPPLRLCSRQAGGENSNSTTSRWENHKLLSLSTAWIWILESVEQAYALQHQGWTNCWEHSHFYQPWCWRAQALQKQSEKMKWETQTTFTLTSFDVPCLQWDWLIDWCEGSAFLEALLPSAVWWGIMVKSSDYL